MGQLLTYAAGLDVAIIVWIAREFREEHRQALDWLNANTSEDVHFFGVEVQALQIDDSRPAVHFHLVAKPNQWQKAQRQSVARSPRAERYREFFTRLISRLKQAYPDWQFDKQALSYNWCDFPSGRSGYVFIAGFSGKGFRVELYIDRWNAEKNASAFDRLHAEREAIEKAVGAELSWERLEGKRACRIACYRDGDIMGPDEEWESLIDWAVAMLGRFRQVFGPYIRRLP